MAPSEQVLAYKREVKLKAGGSVQVFMDIYLISPGPVRGLFLDRFRLSWVAFLTEAPLQRVLMDAHPPVGLHYHFDDGPQIEIELTILKEAFAFFAAKVEERFGELEETLYEDFYF